MDQRGQSMGLRMMDVLLTVHGNCSMVDIVDSLPLCCKCDMADIYSTKGTNSGCKTCYHMFHGSP